MNWNPESTLIPQGYPFKAEAGTSQDAPAPWEQCAGVLQSAGADHINGLSNRVRCVIYPYIHKYAHTHISVFS